MLYADSTIRKWLCCCLQYHSNVFWEAFNLLDHSHLSYHLSYPAWKEKMIRCVLYHIFLTMLVLTMTWNIEDKLKFGQIKQENVRLFRHGDKQISLYTPSGLGGQSSTWLLTCMQRRPTSLDTALDFRA